MAEIKTTKKKKQKKNIISGMAYINATFNNTMITITDEQGNSIACLLYTSDAADE